MNNQAKQFAAAIMSLIFLIIPLALTIHTHNSLENFDKNHLSKTIIHATENCLICDYIADVKGKQIFLDIPNYIIAPTLLSSSIKPVVITEVPELPLQLFSNKSPPSASI